MSGGLSGTSGSFSATLRRPIRNPEGSFGPGSRAPGEAKKTPAAPAKIAPRMNQSARSRIAEAKGQGVSASKPEALEASAAAESRMVCASAAEMAPPPLAMAAAS